MADRSRPASQRGNRAGFEASARVAGLSGARWRVDGCAIGRRGGALRQRDHAGTIDGRVLGTHARGQRHGRRRHRRAAVVRCGMARRGQAVLHHLAVAQGRCPNSRRDRDAARDAASTRASGRRVGTVGVAEQDVGGHGRVAPDERPRCIALGPRRRVRPPRGRSHPEERSQGLSRCRWSSRSAPAATCSGCCPRRPACPPTPA